MRVYEGDGDTARVYVSGRWGLRFAVKTLIHVRHTPLLFTRPLYTAAVLTAAASSSLIPGTRANAATDTRATVIPSPRIPASMPAPSLRPLSLLNSALHDSPRVPAPAILAPTQRKTPASVPLSPSRAYAAATRISTLSLPTDAPFCLSLPLVSSPSHEHTHNTHTFASTHAHIAPTRKRVHAHDRLKNTHGTMPRPLFVAHHLDEDMSFTASCSPSPP